MTAYLALLGGWVLLSAGVAHLLRPGALHWHLRTHGVVPSAAARALAHVLPPLEALLGAAVLVARVSAGPAFWRPLAGGAAALCAAYGAYLAVLAARGFEGACGCAPTADDVGAYTIGRALGLAGGMGAASVADAAASARLVAEIGWPLLILAALAGAFLVLAADAGWAYSRGAMAQLRGELAWSAAGKPSAVTGTRAWHGAGAAVRAEQASGGAVAGEHAR